MKCVAVNVLISPVTTGFSETGGVVPVSLLFFFLLGIRREKGAEGRSVVISTPYVMNFQIPLSHKIEFIKSPAHPLPPTFLTPNLSSLEFYQFAQSEPSCSAVSWDS